MGLSAYLLEGLGLGVKVHYPLQGGIGWLGLMHVAKGCLGS